MYQLTPLFHLFLKISVYEYIRWKVGNFDPYKTSYNNCMIVYMIAVLHERECERKERMKIGFNKNHAGIVCLQISTFHIEMLE